MVFRPLENNPVVIDSLEIVISANGSNIIASMLRCPWHMAVVVKTVLGSHFGVGEFTAHFRTYSSGDWGVHWGYGI